MAFSRLAIAGLVLALAVSTFAHSYVTSPTSRSNQKQSTTGCRGPNCLGPCDVPLSQARTAPVTIARGASINVQWPRNNHAGGFIRFAWAQTSGSDVHANFDAGVQQITCHEVGGCKADNAADPNGGDSNPADGSRNPCQVSIKVPLHLTAGKWTLQWAWFGGAFALGDYYSCVDYAISGGPTGPKVDAVFIPGDATYPANQGKCKFFNTDRLHKCVNEPCNSPIYSLSQEQSGPAYLPSNPSPTPTPTPTPAPTPAPTKLTTGAAGRAKTTGIVVPTPTPTPTPTPSPNPSSNNNCAGLTQVATDTTVTITEVQTWSNVFRMVMDIHANENLPSWNLQILWPSGATNTEVNSVFNAGQLRCHANSPVHHAMIMPASWATSIKKGESMSVEVIADNTNMAAEFIKANTVVKVFKA